ncbi:MAG: HAMP domain-containing protein [Stenomitos rutilans HA7619-LM2]|jgi:twitching motility protein PilJ|nr:HAMP domain-containing protein [Stenomitos rutilans HA7619-LM2]
MSSNFIPSSVHARTKEVNINVNAKAQKNRLVFWTGLSLRLKATLLAVAISTIPIVVVGATAYIQLKESNRHSVEKNEQRLTSEVQNHLNQYMWERYGDIQIMSSLDILTDSKLRQATTTAEKAATLDRFIQAYPIYNSIAAFDLKGDPIAQTKGPTLPNHSDRAYIKEALRTKSPILSQPTISASSGIFSVYAAAPLRDKDTGEIIGTIRARIPVAKLSDLIQALQPQEGSAYYLINASGEVFYGPEGVYVNKVTSSGGDATTDNKAFKEKRIEEIFPAIVTLRAAQKPGSLFTVNPSTHVGQFVTYIPPTTLKGLPALNWSVLLSTDPEIVFAAQKQQLQILLVGLGLTLLIVIAASIYLINRGLRPVLQSAQVVAKIGQGHLEARIPIKGGDELAVLGSNINQMADQIQDLLHTMQQNTEQLKEQNDVLSALARHEALVQGNVQAATRSFSEAIAKTLKLERASIWLYSANRSSLTCLDRYDRSLQQHSDGDSIQALEILAYFEPLEIEPFLTVSNVRTTSALHQLLTEGVLSPGTRALLYVPIQIANRTVGFIQCEHAEASHTWQADEKTFVAGVANLVSIVLESEFLQQEVSHLLDVVSDVEEGDLTTQAKVSDRATGLVADTFNRLIERFAYVLNQVLVAAHQVSESANQQKALVETVATNADQQAQAVNQVLNLTEQVEHAAQGSAERVKVSNESLQTVSSTLVLGQEAIDALTQGIAVLQEGTNRIVQRMKTLGEFVGLADQFVQNQSQIAFVTQTLSLNASLVAARASEQRDPRQFVVVAREFDSIADQVNKLAQQTSEGLTSLEQRSTQIHNAVSAVDGDVQSMGELVRQFTTGVEQSKHVFQTVQSITGEAVQAGEAVNQFSQQIMEAAQSTAHVMRDITGLANKTAALTQVARERSDHMDALAAQLLQTVQFFQLPVDPMQNGQPAMTDMAVTVSAETVASN